MADIISDAGRRRTFAIISHPDAGKTTLTEKLLLYAGAIGVAGAVKARDGKQKEVTSDWMDMERQRGISITSTVLQFPYREHVLNLLDTPGHKDFSEDTYRVITAADAAVIVLDAAKGIEAQTLKLFQVARNQGLPLLTLVNKCDRPGMPPLEILDDIESQLGLHPTPVTWPVGSGPDFTGVVDRRDGSLWRFGRTAHGARQADETHETDPDLAAAGRSGATAADELELLEAVGATHDQKAFLAGEASPVFFGSALWNFGIRLLLDAVVDLAPPPSPRIDVNDVPQPLDSQCSGTVFKVQANLDRDTVDAAVPGDVVGLVNAGDLRIGDTLSEDGSVAYPPIPTFMPEHFRAARNIDTSRYKQFRRGLHQLEEEGVIQVLRHPDRGDQQPVLAAVGPMQYEVAAHRLSAEYGAEVELSVMDYSVARRTDAEGAAALTGIRDVEVLTRTDGTILALFRNIYRLGTIERDHPDVLLDTSIAS